MISYILDNPFYNSIQSHQKCIVRTVNIFMHPTLFNIYCFSYLKLGVWARELSSRFAIKSISEILKWQITENPILKCVVARLPKRE